MNDRGPVPTEAIPLPELLLLHLDSAYNLARWLAGNGQDAEDIVQEACLRALQYAGGFRGGNARAWLLTIVRNIAYTWLRRGRAGQSFVPFDEDVHVTEKGQPSPEDLALRNADARIVEQTLVDLPSRFREILILRELEGLSYKELADVMQIPIGTVMSTLSRARGRFRADFTGPLPEPPRPVHEHAVGAISDERDCRRGPAAVIERDCDR